MAVRWSIKYFFALNSLIFQKSCGREEEDVREKQLLSVTQKYIVVEREHHDINMMSHHYDGNIVSYYTAEGKWQK